MAADPPLLDVRQLLPPDTPPGSHLLRRPMRYYHYGLGHSDHGWGCGYRTVQTILSWLSAEPAPPIKALQDTLKRTHAFSGDRGWIGVPDAVIILDELHGCQARILSLASGAEAAAHLSELAAHFDAGGGPIMIGGGGDVYSKTVVGVSPSAPGALLILDPHYAGTESLNIRPQPLEAGLDVADTSRQALWRGGGCAATPRMRGATPSTTSPSRWRCRRSSRALQPAPRRPKPPGVEGATPPTGARSLKSWRRERRRALHIGMGRRPGVVFGAVSGVCRAGYCVCCVAHPAPGPPSGPGTPVFAQRTLM